MATNRVLREKYKQKRQEHPEIVWTIKQLFEWAVKNGCEDYLLNIQDSQLVNLLSFPYILFLVLIYLLRESRLHLLLLEYILCIFQFFFKHFS